MYTDWLDSLENGPYLCGSFPDIRIVGDRLIHFLLPGEKYVADRGYRDGGLYADMPTGFNNPGQRMHSIVRARHETVNVFSNQELQDPKY
jgi:hypothetical protein